MFPPTSCVQVKDIDCFASNGWIFEFYWYKNKLKDTTNAAQMFNLSYKWPISLLWATNGSMVTMRYEWPTCLLWATNGSMVTMSYEWPTCLLWA